MILERRILFMPDRDLSVVKRDGYGFEAENPIVVERLGLLYTIIDRMEIDTDEKMGKLYDKCLKHIENSAFKYGVFKFELCFKGVKTKIFEMYFTVNSLELECDNVNEYTKDPQMPEGFKLKSWRDYSADKYREFRYNVKHGRENEQAKPFLTPTTICLNLDKEFPEIVKFVVEQGYLSNEEISKNFQLGFWRRHNVLMQLIGLGFVNDECDLGPGKRSIFITKEDYDIIFKSKK